MRILLTLQNVLQNLTEAITDKTTEEIKEMLTYLTPREVAEFYNLHCDEKIIWVEENLWRYAAV